MSEEVLNGALIGGARYGIDGDRVRQCFAPCPAEGKYMADLSALNRLFLLAGGMSDENIDTAGLCTACTTDSEGAVFFSHRASGGHSGTQVSVIGVL